MLMQQVQHAEQRSIAIHTEPQSLPVKIDRSVFKKTPGERDYLKFLKSQWKQEQKSLS